MTNMLNRLANFPREVGVCLLYLKTLPEADLVSAIEAKAAQLQGNLHLAHEPNVRFALFIVRAQQSDRLIVIIHYPAADKFSMRVLLEDFGTAYQQFHQGQAIHLSLKNNSIQRAQLSPLTSTNDSPILLVSTMIVLTNSIGRVFACFPPIRISA